MLRNGQIVTICGTGIQGYNGDGQLATDAQLTRPCAVVVSSSNQVYISEMYGHRIRKIDQHGIISTIAGTGEEGYNGDDQLATDALLNLPLELFVTEEEEVLFCDNGNHRVRKIDRNGILSTIAGNGVQGFNGDDQLATLASLNSPSGVFQYRCEIYIADSGNGRIRKIDRRGIITTIAGADHDDDDTIKLHYPTCVFVHHDEVYFSMQYNFMSKKLQHDGVFKAVKRPKDDDGTYNILPVTTELSEPMGLFVDSDSGVYIVEMNDHCIYRMDLCGGDGLKVVVGIAGEPGYAGDVPFDFEKYPHVGPRKKPKWIKPFPHAYHDLIVICQFVEMDSFTQYEPTTKKIKH